MTSQDFFEDKLHSICRGLLESSNEAYDVIAINTRGRILEQASRGDSTILQRMDPQTKEMFFMEFALRQRMRAEFDEYYGQVEFTYAQRENAAMFSAVLYDIIVIVIARDIENPHEFGKELKMWIKTNSDNMQTQFATSENKNNLCRK